MDFYHPDNKKSSPITLEVDTEGVRVPLAICNSASEGVDRIMMEKLKKNAFSFFLSDFSINKYFITNYHVISKQIDDSNMSIILEIYNKNKFEIKLKKRKIQYMKDLDITIIQINDLEDLCHSVKFLSIIKEDMIFI